MVTKKPSRTATKIARFMVLMDATPRLRGLLPEGAATTAETILRQSGAVSPRLIDVMRKPATVRFADYAERLTTPGQLVWFALRKRWFSETVEEAIAAGARQLLVVGAGFDPLAAMVAARHPQLLCVEVDAPPTAEPKRAGVQRAGFARDNHVILAADLSKVPLADALRETPWQATVKSVVVAEGLLMYLRPVDVSGFFTAVRALAGEGSRLAYSSLDADERGRPKLGVLDGPVRFALRLAGEGMHWGLRPSDVAAFLAKHGYSVVEQPTKDDLRRRFLDPLSLHGEPLAPYEYLVLAELQGEATGERAP